MTLDDEPVDESKMESDSPVVENICDIKGSKRDFSSSSTSSSDNEKTKVENSDNDRGSIGVFPASSDRFDTAKLASHRDGKCNDSSKDEANESYDREAILQRLATLENLDILNYVVKIERIREKATPAPEISSKPENTILDDTDEDCPLSRVARIREALQNVPDSLLHVMAGASRPGDCGRPFDQKPDWLDEEKLRRGQKFARDYMFPVFFSEMLSLFALYSFKDGLKPLLITGKSTNLYPAFKRSLSSGLRFRSWYTQDLWTEGTNAWKDMKAVRTMHAAVRRRLEASTNEEIDAAAKIPNAWCPAREILLKDFSETCEAPAIGQCPYMIDRNDPDRPKGINQTNMALTQWTTVGLIISYPKYFGIHDATEEDLEAYCHLWRSIGYQLGIEDEFNICRGTLKDVRQWSRDFLEIWVKPNLREVEPEWEHVLRCLMSGMSVIVPLISFEIVLFCLTDVLDLHMPRLYASLSYKDWITYNLIRSMLNHGMKLPGMMRLSNFILNYVFDRAANFTPKELKAVQIELSKYSGTHAHPVP